MSAIVHIATGAAATQVQAPGWWSQNILTVLTLLSGVIAGLFAAYKWRSDEDVKSAAAVLERIKSFSETPGTRNAMMILKSRRRPIPVFDPASPPLDSSGIYRDVSWEQAKSALVPTRWNGNDSGFSNAIRDSFEDFINRITQIEIFIAAGMISQREAKPLVAP